MSTSRHIWHRTMLRTLTLSPMFCALNITFRTAFTHSSRLGTDSAENLIVFWFVRTRKSISPHASHEIA